MMELKIVFNPQTGQIQVVGPIDQRMLCYGMLDMAREVIMRKGLEDTPAAKSGLVIPQLAIDRT